MHSGSAGKSALRDGATWSAEDNEDTPMVASFRRVEDELQVQLPAIEAALKDDWDSPEPQKITFQTIREKGRVIILVLAVGEDGAGTIIRRSERAPGKMFHSAFIILAVMSITEEAYREGSGAMCSDTRHPVIGALA